MWIPSIVFLLFCMYTRFHVTSPKIHRFLNNLSQEPANKIFQFKTHVKLVDCTVFLCEKNYYFLLRQSSGNIIICDIIFLDSSVTNDVGTKVGISGVAVLAVLLITGLVIGLTVWRRRNKSGYEPLISQGGYRCIPIWGGSLSLHVFCFHVVSVPDTKMNMFCGLYIEVVISWIDVI